MTNSFLHELHDVDFSKYKVADVQPALDETEKQALAKAAALKRIKDSERTFENTVLAYTRAMQKFSQVVEIVCHLQYMDEQTWTAVQQVAMSRYMKLVLKLGYDKTIYTILKNFAEHAQLDSLQTRMITNIIQDFEESGIHLPDETQKRLKKLMSTHSRLADKYSLNITQSRASATLLFDDESDMAGLPNSFVKQAKIDAKGTDASYAIKINDGSYEVVQTMCISQKTREKMYLAYSTSPAKKNYKIMHELLKLRYEIAGILGHKTPAHMYMRKRMITEPARAIRFLEELDTHYAVLAKREYTELQQFISKLEGGKPKDIPQYEYDSSLNFYYPTLQFNEKFSVELDDIKQYFEFSRVLNGMFDCLSELYGVRFIASEKQTWHPDVQVYHIFDGSKLLAEVHCDWFARDGKHGHAWMNCFFSASKDDEHPHIGCVVMNMPPPTKTEPCLMTPEQVAAMWHEFGHFMHQAFQEVTYVEQGAMEMKRDFIEAPSQIMENWALHPQILSRYAFHYKSNKVLPDRYIIALKQMQLFNVGIKSSRQHFLALLDLKLHHDGLIHNAPKELYEWVKAFRARTLAGPVYKKYSTLATFGHIASGYISGYYTYKWSEMIQADLFSRFEQEGLLNPNVGAEYRNKILARGDEADPDDLIRDFLGRDIDSTALLRRDQISV